MNFHFTMWIGGVGRFSDNYSCCENFNEYEYSLLSGGDEIASYSGIGRRGYGSSRLFTPKKLKKNMVVFSSKQFNGSWS